MTNGEWLEKAISGEKAHYVKACGKVFIGAGILVAGIHVLGDGIYDMGRKTAFLEVMKTLSKNESFTSQNDD